MGLIRLSAQNTIFTFSKDKFVSMGYSGSDNNIIISLVNQHIIIPVGNNNFMKLYMEIEKKIKLCRDNEVEEIRVNEIHIRTR
jgi:hypothetical protein